MARSFKSSPEWIAFWHQRRNASCRDVEWDLTFDQWWAIWQASGHWAQRGRQRDEYCMARCGDVGPYSVSNVYICTQSQNMKDFRAVHGVGHVARITLALRKRALTTRGWTFKRGKRYAKKPYQVVYGKQYIGNFATQQEAEAAHRAVAVQKLSESQRLAVIAGNGK